MGWNGARYVGGVKFVAESLHALSASRRVDEAVGNLAPSLWARLRWRGNGTGCAAHELRVLKESRAARQIGWQGGNLPVSNPARSLPSNFIYERRSHGKTCNN
jgi:hypothetical protein